MYLFVQLKKKETTQRHYLKSRCTLTGVYVPEQRVLLNNFFFFVWSAMNTHYIYVGGFLETSLERGTVDKDCTRDNNRGTRYLMSSSWIKF